VGIFLAAAGPLVAAAGVFAHADECVSADVAKSLQDFAASSQKTLTGEAAARFVAEALAVGLPISKAEYVFLGEGDDGLHVDWIEDSDQPIGVVCGWTASPGDRIGLLIIRKLQEGLT
jgi:hypothetical protein